jgi:hypothetical protein
MGSMLVSEEVMVWMDGVDEEVVGLTSLESKRLFVIEEALRRRSCWLLKKLLVKELLVV